MSMPCVFLSHNKADKDYARFLGGELLRQGANVWFDEWEIVVGDSIFDKIEQGLSNCDYFIILLSKNSVKSTWVREELKLVLSRRMSEGKVRIIPVLIEDCEIPAFVADLKRVDFNKSFEEGFEELSRGIFGRSARPLLRDSYVNAMLGYRKDEQLRTKIKSALEILHDHMPRALDILFNSGNVSVKMPIKTHSENLSKFALLGSSGLFGMTMDKVDEEDENLMEMSMSVADIDVFRAFCIDTGILPPSAKDGIPPEYDRTDDLKKFWAEKITPVLQLHTEDTPPFRHKHIKFERKFLSPMNRNELNVYSHRFADLLFDSKPGWEQFARIYRDPKAEQGNFILEIKPPNPKIKSPLEIWTYENQITVEFGEYHRHFNCAKDKQTEADHFKDALQFVDEIISEEIKFILVKTCERSYVKTVKEGTEIGPRVSKTDLIQRSWKGTHDIVKRNV